MEATHWITAFTHTLQQGIASLADVIVPWLHEFSIAALAAAVVTLGCVMLLELRALAVLRRNVDTHLGRMFEQLDLIRFDHVQLLEAYGRHAANAAAAGSMSAKAQAADAANPTLTSVPSSAALTPNAIAAGEARLLASLAEARARRAEAIRAAASNLSAAAR